VLPLLEQKIVYQQIPRYPSIDRDTALVMDDQITAAEVMALCTAYPSEIIEQVELFDHYKGKNLPQDTKSLGIRVTYRSQDRTLVESEIEPVHRALFDHVAQKTGAKIRGTE
jgi:phenylalanyl-tRNA synthetase beta chain